MFGYVRSGYVKFENAFFRLFFENVYFPRFFFSHIFHFTTESLTKTLRFFLTNFCRPYSVVNWKYIFYVRILSPVWYLYMFIIFGLNALIIADNAALEKTNYNWFPIHPSLFSKNNISLREGFFSWLGFDFLCLLIFQ